VAGARALPWIIHLHAVVFTSWLAFYDTQTTLVRTGRTAVHRRLGAIVGATQTWHRIASMLLR
jgi:hypothetical protein